MHCSDEHLIGHLDGELFFLAEFRLRRHLKSCWRCRTRLEAYEQQIHRVTVEMDEWPFPPQEWRRTATKKLGDRIREVEEVASFPRGSRSRWMAPAWAGVAASVLVLGWHFWPLNTKTLLQPKDVIAHAAAVERTLYRQPVQQTFALDITQIRPTRKTVKAELQIWSDDTSGRFASRLSSTDGHLKHALWRPAADREFVYRAGSADSVLEQPQHPAHSAPLASIADHGLDPDEIEAAFLGWLESRSWSPISITADVSLWASEDGSLARAEKVRDSDGTSVIRITARRSTGTMVAVLSLEVDSNSYRPRLQTIRFESPERSVEFRLAAQSIQRVSSAELRPALFRPDAGLAMGGTAGGPGVPRRETPSRSSPRAKKDRLPAIDPREIQARLILHQAGACLGKAVRVSEDPDGGMAVRVTGEAGSYSSTVGLEFALKALADLRREPGPPPNPEADLETALRHAWALRRLAEDFGQRQLPDPSDPAWQAVASMVNDHAAAILHELDVHGIARPNRALHSIPANWGKVAILVSEKLTRLSGRRGDTTSAEVYACLDRLREIFPEK